MIIQDESQLLTKSSWTLFTRNSFILLTGINWVQIKLSMSQIQWFFSLCCFTGPIQINFFNIQVTRPLLILQTFWLFCYISWCAIYQAEKVSSFFLTHCIHLYSSPYTEGELWHIAREYLSWRKGETHWGTRWIQKSTHKNCYHKFWSARDFLPWMAG